MASAGFGAFYAWHTGSHHGPVLGALSVLMALGLEGAKPFAVEGIFAALRSWSLGRAAAMALLGTVAVGYSLTAELSLMASICDDTAAKGYGPITRRVCAEIATLRAEGEIAAQRERLRQVLVTAERDMATTPPTTKADPAASALATYLAALGITVAVASLSDWLALMPVLALEIGSAFAVVLVSASG